MDEKKVGQMIKELGSIGRAIKNLKEARREMEAMKAVKMEELKGCLEQLNDSELQKLMNETVIIGQAEFSGLEETLLLFVDHPKLVNMAAKVMAGYGA